VLHIRQSISDIILIALKSINMNFILMEMLKRLLIGFFFKIFQLEFEIVSILGFWQEGKSETLVLSSYFEVRESRFSTLAVIQCYRWLFYRKWFYCTNVFDTNCTEVVNFNLEDFYQLTIVWIHWDMLMNQVH